MHLEWTPEIIYSEDSVSVFKLKSSSNGDQFKLGSKLMATDADFSAVNR